jgi:tetratricopeptide (TPR) repeat protein
MARLVILMAMMAVLAGCSSAVVKPEQMPMTVSSLPTWDNGRLGSLAEGENHPAVESLFQKAEQARQLGQWSAALTYLDQARQIQPRNPAVLYRQAWVCLQVGDARRAQQLLQRAKVFAAGDSNFLRRIDALLVE